MNVVELIDRHGPDIYRFCCILTGNKPDGDDLYQETFLKAVEKAQRIDSGQNPKAYLLATAAGLWKSRRRKLARRNRIAPVEQWDEAADGTEAQQAGAEELVLSREERHAVREAVARLSPRLKLPLYMHYNAGMSLEDIAAALGIPAGTVKSRLHHARKALKKQLEGML